MASGLAISIVGGGGLSLLVLLNLAFFSSVPWSLGPMVVFIALLLLFLAGYGPPRRFATWRASRCRIRRPEKALLGPSLVVALGTGVTWLSVSRFLGPSSAQLLGPAPAAGGAALPALLFATGVLLGPLVEEVALRGFAQKELESAFAPRIAVLVVAAVFALLHWDLIGFPLYFGLVLGILAVATDSIVPSFLAHLAANLADWGVAHGLMEEAAWYFTATVSAAGLAAVVVASRQLVRRSAGGRSWRRKAE